MTEPVLVALPGMLCNEQLWARTGFDLGRQIQIYPVPLRGRSIAEMVAAVLALPYPVMDLVGLSLGGIVALRVAATAPGRVHRLAVLSATARPPRPDQHASWNSMAALVTGGKFGTITPDLLLPMLLSPAHQTDDALRETVLDMATNIGPQRFLEQLDAQRTRVDLRPTLAAITCPVLVCAGGEDVLAPVPAQQEIADGVRRGELCVVAGAGHLSPLEQPAEVAMLLGSWLAPEPPL
jgi:pimeloyl-ACP methyl ester carboxylesterase